MRCEPGPDVRLYLYGMSMGGAAILRAVASNDVKPDGIIVEAVFDSLLNTGKNRFHAMGLPGSPFAELLLFWGSVQESFNFFKHNPADYAGFVQCPALVLHGEKDARVSVSQARRIASSIGQRGHFVLFPGVPHMAIVGRRAGEGRRDVKTFVKQLWARS